MQPVVGDHTNQEGKIIASWFSKKQELLVTPPYAAIGWIKDNELVAAALFNDYNGSSVEIHYYGPRGLTRESIGHIIRYVFVALNCNVMIARIPRGNEFKKYLPRLGFKWLCVIPRFFGPDKAHDGLLFYMTKEAGMKWIKDA